MTTSILTYILGIPLLAALLLVFVPGNYRVIIRAIAVLATFLSAALAVKMFCQFGGAPVDAEGYRFVQQVPWVESLGMSYHVGVDGLNVGLVLMGAIVGFAAALCSWEIQKREKEFYILLLIMTGGILGAFASLDLFFFYAFHEFALIPTFITPYFKKENNDVVHDPRVQVVYVAPGNGGTAQLAANIALNPLDFAA